ncbi:endonuclease Q family protein [soil metagenome]
MQIVADLHLHSKYSRAVSPQMILPTMAKVALEKGLQLLTASDWTHPVWFKEISALLEEAGEGIYKLNQGTEAIQSIRFILSTEISCIYKQGDKLRRIHNLIFVSSLVKAEEFSKALVAKGCNISADGRPIVGLTSKHLLEMLLEIDEQGFLIPCHVWTPHFGLYGSASGFDSIEEAFGDLSDYIYGIETGLSSDPEMNWQIPELKTRSILSFSDAHSSPKMAREATMLELSKISFLNLKQAIKKGSSETNKVAFTLEFYPEEGKYHFSGHRNCKIRLTPEELKEKGNICPMCKRPFTEGVFVRLSHLAGKESLDSAIVKPNEQGLYWFTDPQKIHPPYVKLVPLLEIIAESMGSTVMSQKVKLNYHKAIKMLGPELDILLKVSAGSIAQAVGEKIAEGVVKVRKGEIIIEPGYDGEYGKVKLWGDKSFAQTSSNKSQMPLDF